MGYSIADSVYCCMLDSTANLILQTTYYMYILYTPKIVIVACYLNSKLI